MTFPNNIFPDNQEASNAYNIAEHTNKSLYITGKAGTGKSTFLKNFCKQTKKKYIIVAPTGIAALNIGGQTIHSFFNLPARPLIPNDSEIPFFHEVIPNGKGGFQEEHLKRKIIREIDMVIIDEISMVRCDIIDAIDNSLRKNGGNRNMPFGGKQIVFIGDLFQLEPIVRDDDQEMLKQHYNSRFFFSANIFKEVDFSKIEFTKVYRQSDTKFIGILDRIRTKKAEDSDFEILNERVNSEYEPTKEQVFITLCPTNNIADSHNEKHLKNIKANEFTFQGEVDGNFNEKDAPVPLTLVLKASAQVMFVKNDPQGRWVNGSIGKIMAISEKGIKVRVKHEDKGKNYFIEKEEWSKNEYKYNKQTKKIETEEAGVYRQYPIKLAWAITIHKSQGLTFENVIIDIGRGMFAHGQLYVALSRCKSIKGLILKTKVNKKDMIVHDRVINFANEANNQEKIDKEFIHGVIEKNKVLIEMVSLLKEDNQNLIKEIQNLSIQLKDKEITIQDLTSIINSNITIDKNHKKNKKPFTNNKRVTF